MLKYPRNYNNLKLNYQQHLTNCLLHNLNFNKSQQYIKKLCNNSSNTNTNHNNIKK